MAASADWGTDLWDQYDAISVHTQKGIEFLDRFAQFYRERCQVEASYARDLKALVKNFQPKKKDDDDFSYGYFRGFNKMASELHDLAAQHERLAEDLLTTVVARVQAQAKELRDERKRCLEEANKHQKNLQASIQQLEKTKRSYEKAYKEALRANEAYKRADENQELSRKAVEEAKLAMRRKAEEFEQSKQEYASRLQDTNNCQRQFYGTLLPSVFQKLQDLDQRKGMQIRDSIKLAVETEKKIHPIVDRCLQEMVKSAEDILPEMDSLTVVEKYKSGFDHPGDIPFWNLEDPKSMENATTAHNYPPIRSGSLRTVSQHEKKNRKTLIGIFPGASKAKESTRDDFADLPPQQRKRRLQQKLEQLSAQLHQEVLTHDALKKMKGVYESNPAMGDPNSVNGQLMENAAKMDHLRSEMARFQSYLDEMEQGVNSQGNNRSTNSLGAAPNNGGVSMSSSSPVINRSPSEPGAYPPPQNIGNGVGASRSNLRPSNNFGNGERVSLASSDEHEQDVYEAAPGDADDILGTCLALYDFDAQSDGALSMTEGETLLILEMDQGDGWTHVRRPATQEEGFIPTSYAKIMPYPSR